ncbi:MAG TPA: phosphomethylpyrimidine synthase ThiC, partial [Spirochaetota bacterium]|nr:phosphomethylpyrimidine synthase ThiC [Spirochaetota bacterium]
MTQIESARSGRITTEMESVAQNEHIDVELLRQMIGKGEAVIPSNRNHKSQNHIGIGIGLKVKVNANVGTSPGNDSIDSEIMKAHTAEHAGADAIMDLSVAG